MKTDFYTKTVLTIIALCLSILTLKSVDIIPKAYANENDKNNLKLLPNKNYGLIPVNADGSINVNIKSSETIDVSIEDVDTYAFRYCKVPVIVKENEDK